MNSVSFVSAPFSGGQPKAGAELGPAAIFAGRVNVHSLQTLARSC
jgi:arginase family enzyme